MARYTRTPVSTLQGINNELAKVELAMEDTLDRKGVTPNFMDANLDMNSRRVLNLPAPLTDQEPLRRGDLATGSNISFEYAQDTYLSIKEFLISKGLSGNYGFFEQGFSFVNEGDVGIDSDGNIWTYNGTLPFEVIAETVPNEPDYAQYTLYSNLAKNTVTAKRLKVIADDDSGTPDAAITVERTHTRPNSGHGFKEFTVFDPTVDNVAYAAYDSDFSTKSDNSRPMDHMVSYQSRLQHFSLGDLKYYSAVWALDRVEAGATCSNMFQFYDQGRTEGATINHFSFVGNPLVNGTVQNYAGLRVNQPVGNPGGEIQNTNVGVYIEDLSFAGGAATYPVFIESQTNEASIGCYWRFKNRLILEGQTIFKVSPTPDFDAQRDLGGASFRWKQFYAVTNNSTLLNLKPQSTEPTRIAGETIAMSDGTASTNSFGTSGEGIYRCSSSGTWVFVG